VASKWSSASVPANLFAWTGRVNVESAIIRQLAGLIGGHRWASLEERARDSEDIRTSDLEAALSNEPYWRTLAKELLQALNGLILLSPEKRIQPFADLLARHVRRGGVYQRDLRLAEFLLRLASSPASLARIPEAEMKSAIDQVLASPILLRSARFVVLAIDATEAGGSWVWEQ
jgi:hypothetical protein